MCGMEPALAAVIDYEVSLFDRSEIAGAYRSICAMMLLRSAAALGKGCRDRNQEAKQKKQAERWVTSGNTGVITFDEACRAIDCEPETMRDQMIRHKNAKSKPQEPAKPQFVFGRESYDGREVASVA